MSEVKEKDNELQEEVNNKIITFENPFTFEGKKYETVDLSPLSELTGKQMSVIEKKLREQGITNFNPEITAEGAFLYASYASGLPVEFFEQMPAKEAKKVKAHVVNFFW